MLTSAAALGAPLLLGLGPLLVVGGEDEDCGRVYRERTRALRVAESPWVMPDERGLSRWVCRGLTQPTRDLWPRVKIYI